MVKACATVSTGDNTYINPLVVIGISLSKALYKAGDTVITCANASSLDLTKFSAAPDGLKYVAEGNTVKLAADVVTVSPDGSAEVTANNAAEAIAKVEILVPDAMKDVVTPSEYAAYFVKTAEYNQETEKYTVTAALNPEVVKPTIAETTEGDTNKEAFVVNVDGSVTLNISNKKPGLYYGVEVLNELGADPVDTVPETADGLVVPADSLGDDLATKAFFRVVVDFKPIGNAE